MPRDRHIETRLLALRTPDALAEAPTGVRIEVHDASCGQPRPLTPDSHAPGGRGLLLVATLAERWGVSARLGPGKAVWAELLN
ncbi:ATP-binding protein [Streptomyces sp. NPDC000151]|uniref:ATP-binding protein n=1 Tax=Streptomyces sp. NPDC000151 TaxID=3154244 RepID=UPI00331A3DC9